MQFAGFFGKYRLREQQAEHAASLEKSCGTSKTFSALLALRGMLDAQSVTQFLEPTLQELSDLTVIADSEAAAQRLAHAIRNQERIAVFGDYDVDGTTAAAILSEVLERLGGDVRVIAADRFAGGYGLSARALERCLADKPTVLVTCDCGSSDHERVSDAKRRGVDVIVIDHHLVPESALPAFAFLNPRRPDCPSKYKDLVSAGLAFVTGAAVRRALGKELDMREWLDLVALGTIADVAPLHGDNRCLVRAGLARLSDPRARPGIVALMEVAKLSGNSFVSASDVAFRIAPRINASGRLGSAQIALDLLRSKTLSEARGLAAKLEQLNEKRKQLSEIATEQAISQIETHYGSAPTGGVIAAAPDWHPGVLGIVAARLVERFGVSAIACAEQEGMYRGSARACDGGDVHRALSSMQEDLRGWGGHKAAAGLDFEPNRLERLRAAFLESSSRAPGDAPETPIDALVSDAQDIPTYNELKKLEPLGEGNPAPLFAITVRVNSARPVGNGDHLSVELNVGNTRLRGFAPKLGNRAVDFSRASGFIAELRPGSWMRREQVELLIKDAY